MNIFLILYILLIIPLLNSRFDKKIIYCGSTLFFLFIIFYRDPLAATDVFNYIEVTEGKSTYLRSISPTLGLLIDFFYKLLGFNSLTTVQFISIVPIICVYISTIILDLPILLPIFLSSESFVLLSFNAIRQGLSLGFLILALSIFTKEITFLDKHKKSSKYAYFFIILFLFLALLSHYSSFIYILSASILFTLNKFKYIILNLKINKKLLITSIFILIILLTTIILNKDIFLSLFTRVFNSLSLLNVSYLLQTGDEFGQNHKNAIYRLTIMSVVFLYTRIRTSNYKSPKIKSFLNLLFISFLPIVLLTFPLPAVLLSRFSHFYIIPIFLSIFYLNKVFDKTQLIIYSIISFTGIITYSSNAVISNLLYK